MSERTESELDSGTLNSDRVARNVTRDQQEEQARQEAEDAGTLRIDSEAGDDTAAGEGSSGAADPGRHVGP